MRVALRGEKVVVSLRLEYLRDLLLADLQAFLYLLLKISESVPRLESLSLIKSLNTATSSGEHLDAGVTGPTPYESLTC